jgi:hypothetical protein
MNEITFYDLFYMDVVVYSNATLCVVRQVLIVFRRKSVKDFPRKNCCFFASNFFSFA